VGRIGFRGVHVQLKTERNVMPAVYRINYLSRLATRVLLPLATPEVGDARDLYSAVAAIDWSAHLSPDRTFMIDARVSDNPNFRSSIYAAQASKDAIGVLWRFPPLAHRLPSSGSVHQAIR
jgi:putative N6-adenine-specific DNA methylase